MQTLLVDDDPTVIFLVKRLFQHEGLPDALTTFLSPVEALTFLRQQAPLGALPQVILLDLNMPVLNGWEFLDALQPLEEQLRDQSLVYILTSSLASTDTRRAQSNNLVAGLLHKPLDRYEIQAIQARVLEQGLT
ncbi:response regulator [Hymenobacter setariae]|uniref:Response regulator n=1 Tax=Hymenobacter setariae TaxID=2594794 RepID=A0A558BPE1_9BACT|nr:response regulator [Hymenobacter setariae]TVT38389.1 response regulator [Hymenobacter setariae]